MSKLVQALVVGVMAGAPYGALAAGLGLIFAVTRRLHFAMAASFVLAVYVAAELLHAEVFGPAAIAGGLLAGVAFGVLVEVAVYAPIVRRAPEVALLSVFVAGLGLVSIVENGIRLVWPDADSHQLPPGFVPHRFQLLDGVGLTNVEMLGAGVSLALVAGCHLMLQHTTVGHRVRAVQDNPRLAALVGIAGSRVRVLVFAVGSLLVAAVGIVTAVRSSVTPGGGVEPTFLAVVVVFLAGVGSSPLRFAVAGVAVGVVEALANVYVSSAWSPIVVFGLLFAYIAVTPTAVGGHLKGTRRQRMQASPRAQVQEVDGVSVG